MNVNVEPEEVNQDVIWTSGNESIVTVDNGLITAESAGDTIITATSVEDDEVFGTATVNVTEPEVPEEDGE